MSGTRTERSFRLKPFRYEEALAIARELEVAEPVAATLVRRGYRTVEQARGFLEGAEDHGPETLGDVPAAAARILAAVRAGERITVHGDYDCDGVCATAILVFTLRELGAVCDWLIPDRLGEGYGLSAQTVRKMAERGTGLAITADCGIACPDEVRMARESGIEVVVTDHHRPGEELPDCTIVHPVLGGAPFDELCGAAVADKLAIALRREAGMADAGGRDLDLVALATVADVVPLVGENRSLVRRGLAEARRAGRPGMRALMAAASVLPENLDEQDLGFRLAPRVNAAGRLYRADAGVELFLTAEDGRAAEIAAELDRANRERRSETDRVLGEAESQLRELAGGGWPAGIVLAGEGWHPGVVGIVASKLAERHGRPAVLIALDSGGRGRGSGRGVPGFDLLGALGACGEHLDRFGGHTAAAGLEIEADRIEAFRADFCERVAATIGTTPARVDEVDAIAGGESLGIEVAQQLARLGPFGAGNPEVRLLVPGAGVEDVRPMGEGGRHARFSVRSGSRRALGVAFGVNGELSAAAARRRSDLSVHLELNRWNGAVEPRVVLGSIYPGHEEADAAEPTGSPARARPGDEEWIARLEAELEGDPAVPPPAPGRTAATIREELDRRGCSGIAAVAAILSCGEPVLALCADALRRRELAEAAAAPGRFGGGSAAVASERTALAGVGEALEVAATGQGLALVDWALLERRPELAEAFGHVVAVDPPHSARAETLASSGEGYLHRLDGEPEAELALRVWEAGWAPRRHLADLFGELRRAPGQEVRGERMRRALEGTASLPRPPEHAGRLVRVLCELKLTRWEASDGERKLRVVSSEGTDLERSAAFRAYRARFEEGRRFLSRRRQSS